MRSKVAAAEMASEAGIPAVICNGTSRRHAGRGGRRRGRSAPASPPRRGKASSFKLWLKYAKPARGRIAVDDGAARVLRESGSSLLPVGIAAVEGEFEAGDAVEVAADGEVIGKGIADYSAARAVAGARDEERRGARAAAARGRRGHPPRPLRPALERPPATLVAMAVTTTTVAESCAAAKRAARALASASTEAKNAALEATARLLEERSAEILEANAADLADERAAGLTRGAARPAGADAGAGRGDGRRACGSVAALDDPVGEELERKTLASGLDLRKVRVPLGVVAVVYEARPNVTIDCAALTIKSGNAIVLRGSSYAERSNGALAAVVREALAEAGLPEDAVLLLAGGGHEELAELATQEGAGRPADPARRRGPEGGDQGGRDGAGDVRGGRQLPRLRPRRGRPGDGAADRRQRQGRSGPASATRPRRCWSTPRSPSASCPPSSPTCARPGSSWSATSAPARSPARSRSAPRPRRTGTPSTSS